MLDLALSVFGTESAVVTLVEQEEFMVTTLSHPRHNPDAAVLTGVQDATEYLCKLACCLHWFQTAQPL